MEAAARVQPTSGYTYARRQPEKTALYQLFQQHLLTFEQQWTDQADGRTLPKFVLNELHGFMACGILGRGFAHLYCDECGEHHVVAFSCKARAVCPSCLGRRMSEGAADLVDHILPVVPIRQWVLTLPFPLRFPLAFDGKLLGEVLRIFMDTVASWYRERQADRGLPHGEGGAVAVIQRANSDLRLNPHVHAIFLDGLYAPDGDGKGQMFHPAPGPSQHDIEQVVQRTSKRILRFLQRRGVITLVSVPGDGEVTVVADEAMGEKDPLLAKLLAAATAGAPPAGWANKRKPVCIVLDPDDRPVTKGMLCSQEVRWAPDALPVSAGRFPGAPFRTRRAPFVVHRALHRCCREEWGFHPPELELLDPDGGTDERRLMSVSPARCSLTGTVLRVPV
jgi:hypothetical protein